MKNTPGVLTHNWPKTKKRAYSNRPALFNPVYSFFEMHRHSAIQTYHITLWISLLNGLNDLTLINFKYYIQKCKKLYN